MYQVTPGGSNYPKTFHTKDNLAENITAPSDFHCLQEQPQVPHNVYSGSEGPSNICSPMANVGEPLVIGSYPPSCSPSAPHMYSIPPDGSSNLQSLHPRIDTPGGIESMEPPSYDEAVSDPPAKMKEKE